MAVRDSVRHRIKKTARLFRMPGKASLVGLLLVAGGAGISLNLFLGSPGYPKVRDTIVIS